MTTIGAGAPGRDLAQSGRISTSDAAACARARRNDRRVRRHPDEREPVVGEEGPQRRWAADNSPAVGLRAARLQVFACVTTIWDSNVPRLRAHHETLERAPSGGWRSCVKSWSATSGSSAPRPLCTSRDSEPGPEQFYRRRCIARAQLGIRGIAPGIARIWSSSSTAAGAACEGACAGRSLARVRRRKTAAVLREVAAHLLDYLRFERNALRHGHGPCSGRSTCCSEAASEGAADRPTDRHPSPAARGTDGGCLTFWTPSLKRLGRR